MAESAESVVIAIEAQMGGFTPAVTQGASTFDASMKAMTQSASQMEQQVGHAIGNTRIAQMELMHVVRGSADSFASGTPPMMIFTQHLSMLAEAGALAGGSMGKFGAFLGGPWGIAVMAAVSVIGALIAGHERAGQKANEHETFEQSLIRALNGEQDAIDKVTQSMEQRNEQVRQSIALDAQRIAQQQVQAGQEATINQSALATARQQLESARALRSSALLSGDPVQLGFALQQISQLTEEIARLGPQGAGLQGRQADLQTRQDRDLSTAEGRVKVIFDHIQATFEEGIQHAREMAHGNAAELARINAIATVTENQLTQSRLNGVDAARRQDQAQRDLNRDYTAVPFSEVRNRIIANEAPARIGGYNALAYNTSATQNAAGVHSPRPLTDMTIGEILNFQTGTMRPLTRGRRGPNDVGSTGVGAYQFESGTLRQNAARAFGPGFASITFSPENQDRIAEALYNSIRNNPTALRNTWAAFQPGHQGPGDNAASEAQRQAQEAAALAARRQHDEEHYQEELAGLNADLANARRQQIQTVQQAADFEIQQIEEQRVRRDRQIQAEADNSSRQDEANRATYQAHARELIAINDQAAEVKKSTVRVREQQTLDEQRIQIAETEIRDQQSILQAHAALARTVAERRDIELRLLDLQHQEEILAIQRQRAQRNLSADQRAQLDRDEAASNARYGLAQQSVRRQTMGPLEQYFDQIPKTAAEMNEALQGVAVNGLQQLNTGLAQAVTSFLHLGGVAGQVLDAILSDLIKIVLQQAELAAFGGGKGGAGGIFSLILSGLHGGGKGGGADLFGGAIKNLVPKFASGGIFDVGGAGGVDRNLLSINGQPRAMVSGDEKIAVIPQGKMLAFGAGAAASPGVGAAGALTVNVRVDASDAVLVETVQGWVAAGVQHGLNLATGYTDGTVRRLIRPGKLNR